VYGEPRWMQVEDPRLSAALRAFPRQALHAHRIAFAHPRTGTLVEIHAPPPDDLRGLLAAAALRTHE